MKIVSKYKDYYDSVSHQYLDKEILYIREHSRVDLKRKGLPMLHNFDICYYVGNDVNTTSRYFSFRIIGFCGKLYPVILMSTNNSFDDPKLTVGFYTFEDFMQYMTENRIPIKNSHHSSRWGRWYRHYDSSTEDIEDFFKEREHYGKLDGFFSAHNTPCFALRLVNQSYELVINPLLKKYSFFKMRDPFSAHQELYQFVGGYLKQPTRPMVEISDKDKVHKHGFDKWSFRQKGTKK